VSNITKTKTIGQVETTNVKHIDIWYALHTPHHNTYFLLRIFMPGAD
jgi:hypothetical protein